MRKDVDLEPTRTTFHIAWGPVTWAYLLFLNTSLLMDWVVLSIGATIIMFLDAGRIHFTRKMDRGEEIPAWIKRWIEATRGTLVRHKEVYAFSSALPYIIGLMGTLAMFADQHILVIGGVNILAWGDPAARIFGQLFGKASPWLPKDKSWVGFGSFIIVSMVMVSAFVVPFLDRFGVSVGQWLIMISVGSIVGAVAEVLSSYLDNKWVPGMDNILISIVSALAMSCFV